MIPPPFVFWVFVGIYPLYLGVFCIGFKALVLKLVFF